MLIAIVTLAVSVSCSTQKNATGVTSVDGEQHYTDPAAAFVESIIAGRADVENITGNATIKLQAGERDIKLSGALRMRRDEVIRIQLFLPIIGTEVGRMEFTPDNVLIMDRINKQYIRISYDRVDFLQRNNITFQTLQALFWDELVSPAGGSAESKDADAYAVDWGSGAGYVPVAIEIGENKYCWQANATDCSLSSLVVTNTSGANGSSMLTWLYSNPALVGGKRFPKTQEFSFSTSVNGSLKKVAITIDMDEIKTSGGWESITSVSSKYKEVNVETVLSLMMSM